MNKNAYQRKAEFLTRKYAHYLEEYAPCTDDRRLVVNLHNQLVTACKVMEPIENPFICVAFNDHFAEQEQLMAAIVTRFSGKIYKAHQWLDPDIPIYKVMQREMIDGIPMELDLLDTEDPEVAYSYVNIKLSEGKFVYVIKENPDGSLSRTID